MGVQLSKVHSLYLLVFLFSNLNRLTLTRRHIHSFFLQISVVQILLAVTFTCFSIANLSRLGFGHCYIQSSRSENTKLQKKLVLNSELRQNQKLLTSQLSCSSLSPFSLATSTDKVRTGPSQLQILGDVLAPPISHNLK